MKIGILGGGQLARMLALAGIPLGFRFVFYDPVDDCCAAALGKHIQADYDDQDRLQEFANEVDVITYEFENVPLACVLFVSSFCKVYPEARALESAQDRLKEKQLFQKLGIPTPRFLNIDSAADLDEIAQQLGYPFVIKTRHGGYDGKGQFVIRSAEDIEQLPLDVETIKAIAEEWIPFTREISIIAVRSQSGDIVYYSPAENYHEEGILRVSLPRPDDLFQDQARQYITALLEDLDYCGVLALELFQVDNKLLANEFAPRVHNSGHWTIEGATVSQFENHIRAIMNLPLGQTDNPIHCGMINLIGSLPDMQETLKIPGSYFHKYDKEAKPGRKIGHLTLSSSEPTSVEALLKQAQKLNASC